MLGFVESGCLRHAENGPKISVPTSRWSWEGRRESSAYEIPFAPGHQGLPSRRRSSFADQAPIALLLRDDNGAHLTPSSDPTLS